MMFIPDVSNTVYIGRTISENRLILQLTLYTVALKCKCEVQGPKKSREHPRGAQHVLFPVKAHSAVFVPAWKALKTSHQQHIFLQNWDDFHMCWQHSCKKWFGNHMSTTYFSALTLLWRSTLASQHGVFFSRSIHHTCSTKMPEGKAIPSASLPPSVIVVSLSSLVSLVVSDSSSPSPFSCS